ncbi:hypothetical protein FHS42_005699 [Streptomyces zagrosensis]|uniref:Uncharacterized protein n=1 Tax=Streptomyces zagrosensis TaxID=1042984 RepID=A0A7W9V0Y0_9ACTN|nr:hypothetical protein [Streptomyces zagrosensis]
MAPASVPLWLYALRSTIVADRPSRTFGRARGGAPGPRTTPGPGTDGRGHAGHGARLKPRERLSQLASVYEGVGGQAALATLVSTPASRPAATVGFV